MTTNKEPLYWRSDPSWSHRDAKGNLVINDDAPERARKSYAMFKGWLPKNPAA